MRITIKVETDGTVFRTTTNSPEIAEIELDKFITMAEENEDSECDECNRCDKWGEYPEDYEADMEELTLQKAEEIKRKRSLLKTLKEKKDDL